MHEPVGNRSPGDLPEFPTALEGQLGKSDLYTNFIDQFPFAFVVGGPNDALGVYEDIPFISSETVYVNTKALALASAFYTRQPAGAAPCGQDRVLSIIPDVEAHEGTNPSSEPDSHVRIYEVSVDTAAQRLGEAIVLGETTRLATDYRDSVRIIAAAVSRAMDNDQQRNHLSVPLAGQHCDFNWFPTP